MADDLSSGNAHGSAGLTPPGGDTALVSHESWDERVRSAEPRRRIVGFIVRETEVIRHPDEVGDGVGPHLAHGLTAVDLDGDFAETDLGSDLLVEETLSQRAPSPRVRVA